MAGAGYQNLVTLQLAAAAANNIAISQTIGGAGNLTLNGSTVSGGVATLDVARRVLVTTTGNDSGITYTIYGTNGSGIAQSEVVTGPNIGSAYTQRDFKTVTRVATSGAAAANVTVGTNGIGSSTPIVLDTFVNPAIYGAAVSVSGTVNYTIEMAYDDFGPAWDLGVNQPTWYAASGFAALSSSQNGNIVGPCTMIRLTVNSGTGAASMKLIKPLIAGPY